MIQAEKKETEAAVKNGGFCLFPVPANRFLLKDPYCWRII
jgi:hypothetical protein